MNGLLSALIRAKEENDLQRRFKAGEGNRTLVL
jgi:hypothetical protein